MSDISVRADDDVVLTVVRAIADEVGVEPRAVDPPLGRTVDTDALERLADCEGVKLSFDHAGHAVEIAEDGTVTVDGPTGGSVR